MEPPRRGRDTATSLIGSHQIDWLNPSDKDLAAFVESQVKAHDTRHLGWVSKAKVQLAWAEGDQLKRWDRLSRTLVDSYDVEADRIALFVNRIKPAILNWISLITARPVSFRVHPVTSEDADIESARVLDKLAQYYWRKLLGDTGFIETAWMMFCTGCAFLQSTWDPSIGDQQPLTPQEVLEPEELTYVEGGPTLRSRFTGLISNLLGIGADEVELEDDGSYTVGEGDLTCRMLTGFDVIPPFRATSIETSPWLITRQYQHIDDVRDRYGSKADELNPGQHEPYHTYVDYEAQQYSSDHSTLGITPMQQSPEHVLTYAIWRPRNRRLGNGFHGVLSQGKVLKKGKNPYEHGEIPVVRLQELPSPKRFWPPSTVEDLMSLQTEINYTRSQVAEHKAATVGPRTIAERACGLDELAFTSRNEIVEVNPGKIDAIKPWVPEPLPAYLPWWEESLRRDFEDVARNHAPSYGKQAKSIKSGKHAIALQEADARLNSPMMRLLQDSLGHVCRQWGSILHQYVPGERVTTIIGENNEPEVLRWSRESVPEQIHNVTCELGSPMDHQTTLQLIDMLSARGWLTPQRESDHRRVYQWLGQGVTTDIDPTQDDRRNAALENATLLQARPLDVQEGDDDTTHLEEHAKGQKHASYRRALSRNPQIEQAYELHMKLHEKQRVRKVVRQGVYAKDIEMRLAMELGLMPPMGEEPEQGGNGRAQSKPTQQAPPTQGGRGATKREVPGVRPVRASRREQGAPSGYDQRSSGLLVPQQ
jgi:hypothetical protein